jgi:hypothetical protein
MESLVYIVSVRVAHLFKMPMICLQLLEPLLSSFTQGLPRTLGIVLQRIHREMLSIKESE